jgi:hypothetical protein
MKRLHTKLLVLAASTVLAGMTTGAVAYKIGIAAPTKDAELHTAMRKLWTDHVLWTRQYIVSAALDDPSAKSASVRLLRNQDDIGNAIVPYYGAAAGAKLGDLLKQHILIAVDLVTAAKAGDKGKQSDADKRWHANAEDIAEFLSKANPNWPKATLVDMLNRHLALTTQEAVDRLTKNWDDDVPNFDNVFSQAMMMADALSDGIVKQFPAKF